MTTLLGLGLGLALQTPSASAWWHWYAQNIPYGSAPAPWSYPAGPGFPTFGPSQAQLWDFLAPLAGLGGPQFWQYSSPPYGPMTQWSSTMQSGGLSVQQDQTPAGYRIRVFTGQAGAPMPDIGVQGGVLTIRSQSATGGNGMPMYQSGWAMQSIALPADAQVAAMQMQRGDGVVDIFIPRGR